MIVVMKKVGILTLYYKNYNYGGQLQAYALQKTISKLGYSAQQISFVRNRKKLILRKLRGMFEEPVTKDILAVSVKLFVNKFHHKSDNFMESKNNTYAKFDEFMDSIPHSKVVDERTISSLSQEYDLFVVGSDQVWNPLFVTDEFFLNFIEDKPKISYAASIRINNYEKKEGKRIKEHLEKFDGISVREQRAVETLKKIGIEKKIEVHADPTFLISKEEWEEVSKKIYGNSKYIFVYLVRNNKCLENIEKYARSKGYKVLLVSEAGVSVNENDTINVVKEGVGPAEFIGLIKDAELVIANSFHGTAFSIIFNKPFYVYGNINVDDRKGTLLKKMNLANRIISEDFLFNNIEDISIDYEQINEIVSNERNNGIKFLSEKIMQLIR